jgi:hypothetical protein
VSRTRDTEVAYSAADGAWNGLGRLAGQAILVLLVVVAICLVTGLGTAQAQARGAVQVLSGHLDRDEGAFYVLSGLERGQTLYVYASGTSGNLDPFVALADHRIDGPTERQNFNTEVTAAIEQGRDPLEVIPEFAGSRFVAWDDDSGTGYDAAFSYRVPADGDYHLMLISTAARETLGDFRLLIGIDAPEVLTGESEPTGDIIAELEHGASAIGEAVQEARGALATEKSSTFYTLTTIDAGDTVHVFIEATSGDLRPVIVLRDFGEKPLSAGNYAGQATSATLQHTFDDDAANCTLHISSGEPGGSVTSGEYRLLVGINAPEILTGSAVTRGAPVLLEPIEVRVGVKLDQIANVDQKAENFDVVASMQMEWQDDELAFNPDECQCRYKLFSGDQFVTYAAENGLGWPEFTVFNQQGNRWIMNRIVVLRPDGQALYFERFSTTLQAPDFDFRLFPFDAQKFFIRIDSLFPEESVVYGELEGFSAVGEQLGEEEWLVTDFDTSIGSQQFGSRFSFRFDAQRHRTFYVYRILVPLVLIMAVAWVTFFLADYTKRIEVTGANLLAFIAFNFTVSDDLPHLGYLTLMDVIMISIFVQSVLVVVFNVYLKRLEATGRKERAERLDRFTLPAFPVVYVLVVAVVLLLFGQA